MVVVGRQALPGTVGALLLGAPVAPVSLGRGCFLHLDPPTLATLSLFVAQGSDWNVSVPVPGSPALIGVRVTLQAVLGPTTAALGIDVTNAVVLTLGQ